MEYQVHFGKAYAMWLNGYDKDYHRIRTYKNKQDALKCLDRANNCKWVEWTDFITKESEVVCDICDGKGYLTDVYDTEAEETQIQRCDSCKEFVSDKQAQEHVESEVA